MTGHSLGLRASGTAYAWGYNNLGQLGDGTSGLGTQKSSPVIVVGGITNWSQLNAGERHSIGLTSSGIAYAWGLNTNGQLGDNTTSSRSSPVSVIGGITKWSQVTAGGSHSAAINTAVQYTKGFV